jgi:hypothetical protein
MIHQTTTILRVKTQPAARDFLTNKFTGTGSDRAGTAYSYEEWIVQWARTHDCGSVVSESEAPAMTPAQMAEMEQRMAKASALTPQYARWYNVLDRAKQRAKQCNDAARRVMGTIQESMDPVVWGPLDVIAKAHPDSPQEALDLMRADIKTRYGGLPWQRQKDIERMMLDIGGATNPAEMGLVIARFSNLLQTTRGWLMEEKRVADEDGVFRLTWTPSDSSVLPMSEPAKCRFLGERIGHPNLRTYRDMTLEAVRTERSYAALAVDILEMTKYEHTTLEVVDPHPKAPTQVVAALVAASAAPQNHVAFQGMGPTEDQHYKRQRVESPVNPGPCHYWDGSKCSYEEVSQRQCRFVASHTLGVCSPSFTGVPYVQRPYLPPATGTAHLPVGGPAQPMQQFRS